MPIRTGSRHRGLATAPRSVGRLTRSLSVLPDGSTAPAAMSRTSAILAESVISSVTPNIRREDVGWTNLGIHSYRDLPPQQQEKMIILSFWMYRNNAMAKRLIGMLMDFIWGDGINVTSDNSKVKDVLSRYWNDPTNNWPLRGPNRVRDLLIYGEWLHRPNVIGKGLVRMDTIQPDKIKYVRASDQNHEDLTDVIFKGVILPGDSEVTRDYPVKIIHPIYDDMGEVAGYEGDVFFYGLNMTTDNTRGVGELFTLIDYLDLYDDVLFNRAERIANSAAMWWDVELDGMTETQIQTWLQQETQLPPKPGGVWAHNEKSTLTQQVPSMGADDHERDVAILRSHIIASAGFTGTMFDAPGDAGRAVGAEMAESVYKSMKTMQEQVNQALRVELDYVLWQAKEADLLSDEDIKAGYEVGFPQPSPRDIARTGPAMFRLSTALHMFIGDGLLSDKEARGIVLTQVNKLGLSEQTISSDSPMPTKPKPPAPVMRPANNVPGAPAPAPAPAPSTPARRRGAAAS